MAVLQTIRKRSGLLLLAIGFALLAFVVQDLFTKGFKSQSKDVGSINGKDISFDMNNALAWFNLALSLAQSKPFSLKPEPL
jgi:hypothetical protein